MITKREFEVEEVGHLLLKQVRTGSLKTGESVTSHLRRQNVRDIKWAIP